MRLSHKVLSRTVQLKLTVVLTARVSDSGDRPASRPCLYKCWICSCLVWVQSGQTCKSVQGQQSHGS